MMQRRRTPSTWRFEQIVDPPAIEQRKDAVTITTHERRFRRDRHTCRANQRARAIKDGTRAEIEVLVVHANVFRVRRFAWIHEVHIDSTLASTRRNPLNLRREDIRNRAARFEIEQQRERTTLARERLRGRAVEQRGCLESRRRPAADVRAQRPSAANQA